MTECRLRHIDQSSYFRQAYLMQNIFLYESAGFADASGFGRVHKALGFVDTAYKFTSRCICQQVQDIQEFSRSLKALYPCQFDYFILDSFRFGTIEMQTLDGVCKQLSDGHEKPFMHYLEINQISRKLNGHHMIVLISRLPHMRHIRAYHDQIHPFK